MSFENYIKAYTTIMQEVSKETHDKHPTETGMLFEFIDNWIDLVPRDKEKIFQTINSLSGIILLNSWRLTNYITYEILNGKYFEAIRNLRFVFEGSVFAVVFEDAIESRVFEKWESLSTLSLKTEIFQLWEECKRRKVYRKGKIDVERIRKIVVNFIDQYIDPSRREEMQEYVEVYVKILSDKRLYLTINNMIEECGIFLKLNEEEVEELKKLWHELSMYIHFSYPYLETIIEDPEICFMDKFNEEMFKRSLTFYFQTLDFMYAVLVWRFADLREKVKKICEWWKKNFNKTFNLTERTLDRLK